MATPFHKEMDAPLGAINVGANLAAAAILPLLAQVNLLLTGAFGLGPLKADLVAQFKAAVAISVSFGDPIAMLKAAIAAILNVTASLQAALALGIPTPSIQVSASIALAAALQVKLGGINLLIDLSLGVRLKGLNFLAQLNGALSLGPATLYTWSDQPMSAFASDVATHNWTIDGYNPADPLCRVSGVMIMAKDPSVYAGFSFLFPMPP